MQRNECKDNARAAAAAALFKKHQEMKTPKMQHENYVDFLQVFVIVAAVRTWPPGQSVSTTKDIPYDVD